MSLSGANIKARKSVGVMVDHIRVGGGAPVRVQSMTSTDTVDVIRTAAQIAELAKAGSEMVRITVNNDEAAAPPGSQYRPCGNNPKCPRRASS